MADYKKSDEKAKTEEKAVEVPAVESQASKDTRAMVKAVLEETLPMAMMASAQAAAQMLRGPQKPVEVFEKTERCTKCGQLLRACLDQHVKLVVAPQNKHRFRSFPGIQVNSICYKSPSPTVAILVPRDNDISYGVRQWEASEEALREGRELTHDSGVLSPKGNKINEANPIGFSHFGPGA